MRKFKEVSSLLKIDKKFGIYQMKLDFHKPTRNKICFKQGTVSQFYKPIKFS